MAALREHLAHELAHSSNASAHHIDTKSLRFYLEKAIYTGVLVPEGKCCLVALTPEEDARFSATTMQLLQATLDEAKARSVLLNI
jgi:hypothetical protein